MIEVIAAAERVVEVLLYGVSALCDWEQLRNLVEKNNEYTRILVKYAAYRNELDGFLQIVFSIDNHNINSRFTRMYGEL